MIELNGFRVAVLATDGFEESELTLPVKALKSAGAQVTILSIKRGEIQGVKHQEKAGTVPVDHLVSETTADAFDGVLLPGGALNADALRASPDVQAFLKSADQAGKPIGAICHAPWELISAGLVRGRTLTGYHTIRDDVVNAGGNWFDLEVAEDRNWVTSRQPSDIPAFNAAMLKLFSAQMSTVGGARR